MKQLGNISVSVIVPVYNVSDYIIQCVNSVTEQTYQGPIELILVDDGSTDDSIRKVEAYISDKSFRIQIRIIKLEENSGICIARNTGLRAATGEYVYFLDSDDELTADCLECLVSPLQEEMYDMVIGNVMSVGDSKMGNMLRLGMKDGTVLRNSEIIRTYRIKWNMLPTNKLYRHGFLLRNCLSFKDNLRACEDELWNLETASLMESMRVVRKDTYIHYYREGSISKVWGGDVVKFSSCSEIILQELRKFVHAHSLFNDRLYFFFQWFFNNKILVLFTDEPSKFVEKYSKMLPIVRFPWSKRLKANGLNLKWHIRDLHYWLPGKIAPYWQLCLLKLLKH